MGEAGDWDKRRQIGGRVCGDRVGDVCVCVCVCVCSFLCVPAYPLVRAAMLFVAYGMAFLVAGKSFLYVAVHVKNSLRSSRSDTHTHNTSVDRVMASWCGQPWVAHNVRFASPTLTGTVQCVTGKHEYVDNHSSVRYSLTTDKQ